MLDFALVREALKERGLLLERLAPHLVKPVPFLYPLQHKGWERLYAGSGVALYDAMSMSSGTAGACPRTGTCRRRHALRVAPALRKDALVGALQYYDAQMDDARYVATLVRTAAAYGAQAANRARVVGFLREGERVVGARVQDVEARRRVRDPGQAGRQRHRGVDGRHPGADRRARAVPRPGVQGHPPGRAEGPHPLARPG